MHLPTFKSALRCAPQGEVTRNSYHGWKQMTDPSFYYAIYKRLQATAASHGAHINSDNDPQDQFYGGFSLKYADATYGIFTHLGPQSSFWGYNQNMKPLKDNDTTPANNPMWAILNASLGRRAAARQDHGRRHAMAGDAAAAAGQHLDLCRVAGVQPAGPDEVDRRARDLDHQRQDQRRAQGRADQYGDAQRACRCRSSRSRTATTRPSCSCAAGRATTDGGRATAPCPTRRRSPSRRISGTPRRSSSPILSATSCSRCISCLVPAITWRR